MFFAINQQNYAQLSYNQAIFQQVPMNTVNQTSNEKVIGSEANICQRKLMILLKKQENFNHYIDLQVIKKYYLLPFDSLPEKKEIFQIAEKISQRNLSNQMLMRNWYHEDLKLLTWLCAQQSFEKLVDIKRFTYCDWQSISDMIPFKSARQCKQKWFSLEKMDLQRKPWSIEEDLILRNIIMQNPYKKWNEIAKLLFENVGELIYRAGKFCRERWNNYLCPNIKKGVWALYEDLALLSKVLQKNKKWSEISREIVGRTENAVKNRFNSLMKKWEISQKYSESTLEITKIQELYDNFVEKSKSESYNRQRNNILLMASLKKTQSYAAKKRLCLKDVVEKNNSNLLFELIESENKQKQLHQKEVLPTELKRKQEYFIKQEPPLRKNIKIEENNLVKNIANFSQIKTEYHHANINANIGYLNCNENALNAINTNRNHVPMICFGNQQNLLFQNNFCMNFMRNHQSQQRSFSYSSNRCINNHNAFNIFN